MNSKIVGSVAIVVAIVLVLLVLSVGMQGPVPTIQYDQPIGPLLENREFYSKALR